MTETSDMQQSKGSVQFLTFDKQEKINYKVIITVCAFTLFVAISLINGIHVFAIFKILIGHLDRLRSNQWLDDVVIMEYLIHWIDNDPRFLLVDSIVWSPGFVVNGWEQQRRNQRLPTVPRHSENWQFAIIPINLNNEHWTIGILNRQSLVITYFDTLHGMLPLPQLKQLFKFCTFLTGQKCYFLQANLSSYMRQTDGVNCGVLICMIVENYFLNETLFFSNKDIIKWRNKVYHWLHEKYFGKKAILEEVTLD